MEKQMYFKQIMIKILLLSSLVHSVNCQDLGSNILSFPENSEFAKPMDGKLPYFSKSEITPIWEIPKEGVRVIQSFRFLDQNANEVTEKRMKGEISVVSFFFTRCAGICPTITNNLKIIQSKKQNNVRLYSFSATPDLDSPSVLKKYAKERGINHLYWSLLTGEKEKIYDIARNTFRADTISAAQNRKKVVTKNDFLHSENIYLLDKELRLRGIYNGRILSSINDLLADIEVLKKE
ncbi:SCO family protein [Leptospira sp. 96542]|nr:SCO family protein [Leptospira sp. 96542]